MKPGIYDLEALRYHEDPCDQPSLSASIAKTLISQSPAHAKAAHPRLNPLHIRQDDSKYDVGTAVHKILLEGENAVEIIHHPDWRTKAAKEERDLARAHGRIPLLFAQSVELDAMVEATRTQLDALDTRPRMFTNGTPEKTIVWEENGVTCRARLDWLHDDYSAIDDYKSTKLSANPASFSKSIYSLGYHIQARFYQRGVTAVTGKTPIFRFCVVETSAPFALTVFSLTPEGETFADMQIDWALETWKRCLETDSWPAYTTRLCHAEPPGWAEAAWLEREALLQEAA